MSAPAGSMLSSGPLPSASGALHTAATQLVRRVPSFVRRGSIVPANLIDARCSSGRLNTQQRTGLWSNFLNAIRIESGWMRSWLDAMGSSIPKYVEKIRQRLRIDAQRTSVGKSQAGAD